MFTSVAASWQNLPADILLLIAESSEIRLLRAVCSSWRSSLPLADNARHPLSSTKIPLPLFNQHYLPRRDDLSFSDSSYLMLTECNIYCLEPVGNDDAGSVESCWIVKLEEMSSGKMRFYNPLSFLTYPIPAAVDFFDCRVILVGKEYTFRHKNFGYKVVLSDDAMLCRFDKTNVGYFKFGDERWTIIVDHGKDELSYFTSDIIYHKQKFYVIYSTGRIIVFDSSLKVEEFVSPHSVVRSFDSWFFVQSCGDLFVLKKYYHSSGIIDRQLPLFKVYRLNSDEEVWVEVTTNLGDQTFFISSGSTFSISAEQFSGCGKNLIYCADIAFARKEDVTYNIDEPGFDVGVYNLNDNSSCSLYASRRYSRLFWPIPLWLMP